MAPTIGEIRKPMEKQRQRASGLLMPGFKNMKIEAIYRWDHSRANCRRQRALNICENHLIGTSLIGGKRGELREPNNYGDHHTMAVGIVWSRLLW